MDDIFRFIHKYKNSCNKGDELRLRHHQRRFLQAIYEFRRIKWDQRKLQERGNLLLDFGKVSNDNCCLTINCIFGNLT